jgi:hypothetical protein
LFLSGIQVSDSKLQYQMKAYFLFRKLTLLLRLISMFSKDSFTQSHFLPPSDQFRKDRLNKVVWTETAIFAITSIGLYYLWYKKFPKSRFHLFNDRHEWMQIDKVGHAATAYNISAMQYDLLRWSGVKQHEAILSASLTSLAYMSIIEIMDGFSRGWGFSSYDMLANLSGTALFAAQQYGWNEQRIGLKASAHFTPFAKENKSLLGNNRASRLMKDYNGQTYWLTFNLRSFLPVNSDVPHWLNLSLGYGAEGMVRAKKNLHDPLDTNFENARYRQFYIALDADMFRIPANGAIQSTFYLTKFLKTPAPAIEFNSKRKFKLHAIYF